MHLPRNTRALVLYFLGTVSLWTKRFFTMIPTSGVLACHGPSGPDSALVPQTITMMRQASNKSKAEMSHHSNNSRSKDKFTWQQDRRKVASSPFMSSKKVLPRTRTPSKMLKVQHTRNVVNPKDEIEHKRKLWRVFRRKMNEERLTALELERQQAEASDVVLQILEQELELDAHATCPRLVQVDLEDENSPYELILPTIFNRDDCHKFLEAEVNEILASDDHSKSPGGWSLNGGFWDFVTALSGKTWLKPEVEDGDTLSTADETSIASEYTMNSESEASWYSWQSGETQRVSNRGGTRELLMKHFGGENDSPWLAAKRGDLNALENRWKYRHDWTLQDEYGNTPLYYACRYGGERNIRVVLFLLQQWPSTQHIPPDLLNRCKEDAANLYIQEILINPCHAELIMQDFEQNYFKNESHDEEEEESEEGNASASDLYDIYEDDNE